MNFYFCREKNSAAAVTLRFLTLNRKVMGVRQMYRMSRPSISTKLLKFEIPFYAYYRLSKLKQRFIACALPSSCPFERN
jgi:hypothetical protein